MKKKIIYVSSLILSLLLLVVGYAYISGGGNVFGGESPTDFYRAKITEITDIAEKKLDDDGTMVDTTYTFTAIFKSGPAKGESITATQLISSYAMYNPRPVSEGDNVILYQPNVTDEAEDIPWCFAEYVRSDAVIVLAVLFCLMLVVFGRIKGLRTLYTLILTIGSVFFVLVPAIFTGHNIYLWTIIVCLYITAMTLIIVNGVTELALVGGIGCMGGVLISAGIYLVCDVFVKLTGYTDECTIYLQGINDDVIDVKALVFAAILVGSIGAVMDVAVNIAASLHEIAVKVKDVTFTELYRSGLTISRDIIGTMSNTLILAYIGSSLCSVLLIIYNNSFSLLNMFNKENIVVELLKILVGSFGILSALPLTSFVSALIYCKKSIITTVKEKSVVVDEYSEMLEKSELAEQNAPLKEGKNDTLS